MLETIEREDTTSVIAGRQLPHQVLGTDVSSATNAREVMEQAKLTGWDVHLRPLQTVAVTEEVLTMDGVGTRTIEPAIAVPSAFATVRTSPFTGKLETIGVVGDRYTPTQNEQLADLLDAFATESGGKFTAAADFYGNGKQVFFTIALPGSVKIGGVDVVDHYLSIFTSHNGSTSIAPVVHNMRVACANQRIATLRSSDAALTIRHTASVNDRLALIRRDLDIAFQNMNTFDAKAEALFAKKVSDTEFDQIVAKLFDTPGKVLNQAGETKKANRNYALKQILHGPTNAGIDGTGWAAYNAVTEYLQHNHSKPEVNARRALGLGNVAHRALADNATGLLLAL